MRLKLPPSYRLQMKVEEIRKRKINDQLMTGTPNSMSQLFRSGRRF